MSDTIRWGILGAGNIARSLASAIQATPDAELAAVGSRDLAKAEAFSAEFGGKRSFGSYEELAACGEVDVVYVATPHPMHRENTLLCLEHGRAVLCEKPFALNAAQGREMVGSARSKNLFLMEAMWTRCFPITRKVRELVHEGAIGKVRMVTADFGFQAGFNPASRLFDPKLGGGALLDVGIYCLSYASMLLGKAVEVASMMKPAPTGVDSQSAFVLGYADGAMAVLSTTLESTTPWEATILGDKGRIRVQSPFWKPSALTLDRGQGEERIEIPYEGNGYQFQVEEVGLCLREGRKECPTIPLDETLSILETMDEIRGQWGLRYPDES